MCKKWHIFLFFSTFQTDAEFTQTHSLRLDYISLTLLEFTVCISYNFFFLIVYRVIRDVWVFVYSQHLGLSFFFVILFRMEEFAPAVLFVVDCTSTKVAKRRNYKSNTIFCSLVHVKNFYYYRKRVINEYNNIYIYIYHWRASNQILFSFSSHRTSNLLIFFFYFSFVRAYCPRLTVAHHRIKSVLVFIFLLNSLYLLYTRIRSQLAKTRKHHTQSSSTISRVRRSVFFNLKTSPIQSRYIFFFLAFFPCFFYSIQ